MARTSKKTEVTATETAIKSMEEDIKTENKTAEVKIAAEKAKSAKTTAKKETAKSRSTAGKTAVKSSLSVQFGGKELSEEGLVKIAKEIWKGELKRKAGDLSSVELYLKPEENKVYYVMNKDITGSFDI